MRSDSRRLDELAALAADVRDAEEAVRVAIERGRDEAGPLTWVRMAPALGMSAQMARRRYGR